MSVPFGSNVLTFSEVAKQLRTTFETFTDRRRGKNTHYKLALLPQLELKKSISY